MLHYDNLLQSINRAIRAEEKQGFINTGAVGGFSVYLADAVSELSGIFSPEIKEQLTARAITYGESSPLKRRSLLVEIKERLALSSKLESNDDNIMGPTREIRKVEPERVDSSALQYIKGVGPQRFIQLGNLGIKTLEDLFKHYPRRYEIRQKRRIDELMDGELATINGKVTGSQVSRGRIKVIKLNIEQDNKSIHAIWFNQVHIVKQFPQGTEVSVTGKVRWNKRIPEILATDIIKGWDEGPEERIVPVYPETARLNSKAIREIIKNALPQADKLFPEVFPLGETELMGRAESFKEIHLPSSKEKLSKARSRLVIEEILFLQLAIARLRSPSRNEPSPVLNGGGELVKEFISQLAFHLTDAQQRVIQEIFQDMGSDKGMTRLVQGDVGSGKTVVAMAALLQAVGSGFQAAMMVPTEVLAQQHFESLSKAFKPLGVEVALLIGNQTKSDRDKILHSVISGKVHVVVGTHALIQQAVHFNALGLVVTDEQHRFGVRQRTKLQEKGENPHVLVMTATPIPRTLALTAYGDLQLSVIDEMPKGRKPIITKKITERNRSSLEKFMEQQISVGRQIYVVCPLVEETEKSDLVSATQRAELLNQRCPDRTVILLHGRMKAQEKDDIMQRFRGGDIDILVATTVVEVGVNVPNATVMVIEDAQRFGLAQLHQLRGRVGRGEDQSYCLLVSEVRDSARLNILCETEDGFKIAEEDLKIRGPGELFGFRQHGVPELKLADLTKDGRLIEYAYRLLQKALAEPERFGKLYAEVDRIHAKDKIGVN
ncbi:MAG: ATP-dependent DNA helicase RecG [Gracilibacter sp. BRH_c7a]|nr:MAG: ATP-dependent DNA helicase RecG [Gracilibacter sp. BRH_c7a]